MRRQDWTRREQARFEALSFWALLPGTLAVFVALIGGAI